MKNSEIENTLKFVEPFKFLNLKDLKKLSSVCKFKKFEIGERLNSFDEIPYFCAFVLSGELRLLTKIKSEIPFTLEIFEGGNLCGWSSGFRGIKGFSLSAKKVSSVILIPISKLLDLLVHQKVIEYFSITSIEEWYSILKKEINAPENYLIDLSKDFQKSFFDKLIYIEKGQKLPVGRWYLTNFDPKNQIENTIYDNESLIDNDFPNKKRFLKQVDEIFQYKKEYDNNFLKENNKKLRINKEVSFVDDELSNFKDELKAKEDLEDILGMSNKREEFPSFTGEGIIQEIVAIVRMLSRFYDMPFRKDNLNSLLKSKFINKKYVNQQELSAILEFQGFDVSISELSNQQILRINPPAVVINEKQFLLVWKINNKRIVLNDVKKGRLEIPIDEFDKNYQSINNIVLNITKSNTSPSKRFGIYWFLPEINKHKKIFIQVFITSFFVQLLQLFNPLLIQQIIDAVISQGNLQSLNIYGLLLIVFALSEAILGSLRTFLFNDTTNRIDISLGKKIVNHMFRLPLSYFSNRPIGEVSSRVNELNKIRNFLTNKALTTVLDSVFSVIYISVMFIYSVKLTIISLAVIPFFVFLTIGISPILKSQIRKQAKASSKVQSHLVESLGNIETIKSQDLEYQTRLRWEKLYGDQISENFKNTLLNTASNSTSNFLQKISGLITLWFGAGLVLNGNLSLGQLIAFRIIAGYVTQPLLRITSLWQSFQEILISLERLSDIIDNKKESEINGEGLTYLEKINGDIKYRNIFFSFKNNSNYSLKNINFHIKENSSVGIIGKSGCGKSTLVKLISKLYQPSKGDILIDNFPINQLDLYSLRKHIGLVPQESVLFEGTIRDNISISKPNADLEEIRAVAKLACADEFIQFLPHGYNTMVGERGKNLSGGQRQRIAIARTLLIKPKILILDESSSALDIENEKKLISNLLNEKRTTIFITHRIKNLQDCSLILVMDKGSIVEKGTHNELVDMNGRYANLISDQEFKL